ncbi:IS6 family transposase, partial [Corynebacterium aurimucosum]|nr:IS6 family transposase [Corynebacterium guaraldiae]
PQSGRGDRQPGLRDGLRTPARSGHQEMRNWVVSALRPTLQQHR